MACYVPDAEQRANRARYLFLYVTVVVLDSVNIIEKSPWSIPICYYQYISADLLAITN